MDNLLMKQSVQISRCVVNSREECGVSSEYSLPDYCPDIAVILKCLITPMIQNRQWSGDQLLIDGSVLFRVLYLDEDRCRIHSVEFSHPFSCSMKTDGIADVGMLSLDFSEKYVNCRALSPRRIEARCGVEVYAFAECADTYNPVTPAAEDGLMSRCEELGVSSVIGGSEKILTVSESFDFPNDFPGAELLLGGECRADVRECKLLNGKAIVKGRVYIHQLYADDHSAISTHCLDYSLPYSQILDIEGCCEGLMFDVNATVLSDTERCISGPDGANSVLEVTAKLLIQCKIHKMNQVNVLLDAYHIQYPMTVKKEETKFTSYLGCGIHQSVLPMLFPLPNDSVQEILDVWIIPRDQQVDVNDNIGIMTGKFTIAFLARDREGEISYYERLEEYKLEQPCQGNRADASVTVGEVHYRVVDGKIELQVGLNICLRCYEDRVWNTVRELQLHSDSPYFKQKSGALMYYAQSGEHIWDIGRNCRADAQSIYKENDLQSDIILRPTLLVIPLT